MPFLWSCEKLDAELPEFESNIVVEGWLTDIDTFQYVRLTRSQTFSDISSTPIINTATVQVQTGNILNEFNYHSDGWYKSENKIKARAYFINKLWITLSTGEVIVSESEVLNPAPDIDSLRFDFYEQESTINPNIKNKVYYPIATIKDDSTMENHYRWKIYRNDTLFDNSRDWVLISDQFFNGNETTFANEFTQFEFSFEDVITLELLQISRNAFNFLRNIKSQTTTLGTESSVTPANVEGNLKYLNSDKKVLGFWGVTSVKKKSIKISE